MERHTNVAQQQYLRLSTIRERAAGRGDADVDRAIGQRLMQARHNRELSHGQLAALSGVAERDIASFERGTLRPSPQALASMADALDVAVASFFRFL